MYHIIVASEPSEFRPLHRWRVAGPRLLATGIALTEDEAWRQARLAAAGRDGGAKRGPCGTFENGRHPRRI